MKIILFVLTLAFMFAAQAPAFAQGDVVPKDGGHDWNLGPTGLRGWMFCDKMVTTGAREISITKVCLLYTSDAADE